jgi:hypothetical protein
MGNFVVERAESKPSYCTTSWESHRLTIRRRSSPVTHAESSAAQIPFQPRPIPFGHILTLPRLLVSLEPGQPEGQSKLQVNAPGSTVIRGRWIHIRILTQVIERRSEGFSQCHFELQRPPSGFVRRRWCVTRGLRLPRQRSAYKWESRLGVSNARRRTAFRREVPRNKLALYARLGHGKSRSTNNPQAAS